MSFDAMCNTPGAVFRETTDLTQSDNPTVWRKSHGIRLWMGKRTVRRTASAVGEQFVESWKAQLPAGTDLRQGDVLSVEGRDYRVVGVDDRRAGSGPVHHRVAYLEALEGGLNPGVLAQEA